MDETRSGAPMTTETDREFAEFRLLTLMTPNTSKFALAVGLALDADLQFALERLQIRGWVRLIDLSVLATAPGLLFRVFYVLPEAVAWFEERRVTFRQ